MTPLPPVLLEIVEVTTSALFAGAVLKSLHDTVRSVASERLARRRPMGKAEASAVYANVQELKAASAEIDDLKFKIDELIRKNERLALRLSAASNEATPANTDGAGD